MPQNSKIEELKRKLLEDPELYVHVLVDMILTDRQINEMFNMISEVEEEILQDEPLEEEQAGWYGEYVRKDK